MKLNHFLLVAISLFFLFIGARTQPPEVIILYPVTVIILFPLQQPDDDFEDLSFHEEEFQYFYNLELVQEFTMENKENETVQSGAIKVDDALKKLEVEGDLIENVLNDIENNEKKVRLLEAITNEAVSFSR